MQIAQNVRTIVLKIQKEDFFFILVLFFSAWCDKRKTITRFSKVMVIKHKITRKTENSKWRQKHLKKQFYSSETKFLRLKLSINKLL